MRRKRRKVRRSTTSNSAYIVSDHHLFYNLISIVYHCNVVDTLVRCRRLAKFAPCPLIATDYLQPLTARFNSSWTARKAHTNEMTYNNDLYALRCQILAPDAGLTALVAHLHSQDGHYSKPASLSYGPGCSINRRSPTPVFALQCLISC